MSKSMGWIPSSGKLFSSRTVHRLATTTAALCLVQQPAARVAVVEAMAFSSSRFVGGNANDDSSPLVQVLQGAFAMSDCAAPIQHFQHPYMTLHHITEPIGSTQDEARKLLHMKSSPFSTTGNQRDSFLAVIADQQISGRGTHGRTWESSQGNLYLTVALPMSRIPVMLTMLPLQIAVLVADRAEIILQHCAAAAHAVSDENQPILKPKVTVKWPNDVLVNDAKLSGTLIESESVENETWFLIGIGVNVQHAPSLVNSPGKQIRPAVSLQDYCASSKSPSGLLPDQTALYLGIDLAYGLADWVMHNASTPRGEANQAVLDAWKARAEFGKAYEIRSDIVEKENHGDYAGEQIVAMDIAPDGQLKIRGADGRERFLVTDYFF